MRPVIVAELVTFATSAAAAAEPMTLDPWKLIMGASPVVMIVMLLLAGMSVTCWFIIGAKLVRLSQASRQSSFFLRLFWDPEQGNVWSVKRFESLYAAVRRRD